MDIWQMITRIKLFWFSLEKTEKVLLVLLILSFLMRTVHLLYLPIRGWDESVYLNLGRQLSNNPFGYSLLQSGWSDFIPSHDLLYGWPNIGFRAPLLPYFISFFYFFRLDFLVEIINPLIGTLSVGVIYLLTKKLFDNQVAIYSAVLFSLVPLHLLYSGQLLTDSFFVFFILLTFLSFWEGYEQGKITKKIMFGFFLSLALLARYTTLWVMPVFFFYFVIKNRSLKFIKDKYLWYAIAVFLLTLAPWFLYGFKYYGNFLGAFIHGFKAASYWGGVQSWSFFFVNSWQILSILAVVFPCALIYIIFKKEFTRKELYLLLIWVMFVLMMALSTPHKEERFIMPVIPAVCIISAFFVSRLGGYRNFIFGVICIVLIISFGYAADNQYQISKNKTNLCFLEGMSFLADGSTEKNSLVITNQSPIAYYYTKKDNYLYPDPWSIQALDNLVNLISQNRTVLILFSNYDMIDKTIKGDLEDNYQKVFECSKDWGYSAVYKYRK